MKSSDVAWISTLTRYAIRWVTVKEPLVVGIQSLLGAREVGGAVVGEGPPPPATGRLRSRGWLPGEGR